MYILVKDNVVIEVSNVGIIVETIDDSIPFDFVNQQKIKPIDCIYSNDENIVSKCFNASIENLTPIIKNNEIVDVTVELNKSPIELLQERILQLEVAEVNRKSKEIEQQILGGI